MIEVNNPMNYYTRRWVKSEDLNGNGTLFGGRLLAWLDEEGIIYATIHLQSRRVVTKKMSEINFVSSPKQGDIVELGMVARKFGKTSITLEVEVRNKMTKEVILTIDELVFVNLGDDGRPAPHGKTEITDSRCSRCPLADPCLHVGAESALSARD